MGKHKQHKTKAAYAAQQFSSQKKPRFESGSDPGAAFPSWRIGLLELVDPFGWHEIGKVKLEEVRSKLANFESMTWDTILGSNNHAVSLEALCTEARERLKAIRQDDIEELISLRFSGKERIWGIREGSVLKVLWWDPQHLVCPSTKRHT